MKAAQLPLLTLFLVLTGAGMITVDLVTPRSRSPWFEVSLGLLVLGLMSVNHKLSLRKQEHPHHPGAW